MYHLAPDLHFALCPTRTIFLDVNNARYFCLPIDADNAFRRWAHGECSEQLFTALGSLIGRDYLIASPSAPASGKPYWLHNSATEEIDLERSDAPWRFAILALVALLRARWIIRRGGFKAAIDWVSAPAPIKHVQEIGTEERDAVRAYLVWRRRFPVAASCLLDSLAMLIFLRRLGQPAMLVVGVSDKPFTAHCWLQDGHVVLNDTVENVADFVPILEAHA